MTRRSRTAAWASPSTSSAPVGLNGDFQSNYARCVGRDGTRDPLTGRWTVECGLMYSPGFAYNAAPGVLGTDWTSFLSATNHSGSANLLMGDGSVRQARYTIAIDALHALATRSGGETVPDSD